MPLNPLGLALVAASQAALTTATLGQAADPSPDPSRFAADLEAFVDQVMERFEIPGLAVAVTRGHEVFYVKAFGVRNADSGEPMRPEYLFHMASVSKPFVATAIVQLAEQDKLDLDAPVTTYLPYFELDDARYTQITIRQMLNHTSGMPDVADYEWGTPQYDKEAAERFVRGLTGKKMLFDPGEQFRYSNMAYDTLGDVIAKVSGEPFEDYVKKNILDPIGMTASTFLYPETDETLRTTPHTWELKTVVSPVYPYNRRHAPSSTLNASVVEMTRWIFVNLNGGELDGKRILEPASHEMLWTPTVQATGTTYVGLGWFVGEWEGRRVIAHGGSDTGFNSYVLMIPEDQIGVVLASNYDQVPMRGLRKGIAELLYGIEPEIPRREISYTFVQVLFEQGFDAAREHYLRLQAEAADEYVFNDRALNSAGYGLLQLGHRDEALLVFQFNAEQYPDVANCWDSLGEAHLRVGNRGKAIECYQKALELDPDFDNARKMLEKIEGE